MSNKEIAKKSVLKLEQKIEILEFQNKIAEVFLTSPEDKAYSNLLDLLLDKFESKFGYFGYIDSNGDLVCPSMTRDIWSACKVREKSVKFAKENWGGIWGSSLKGKKSILSNGNFKTPKGHLKINRVMLVPIIYKKS